MKCKYCNNFSVMPFYNAFYYKRKKYPDQSFDINHIMTSNTLYCSKCKTRVEIIDSEIKIGDLHHCGGILKQAYGYYLVSVCKKCNRQQS